MSVVVPPQTLPRAAAWPVGRWLAAAAVAIGVVTVLGAWLKYREEDGVQRARLKTINHLPAQQIARWLVERTHAAGFLSTSESVAEAYLRWHEGHVTEGLARMVTRFDSRRVITARAGEQD